MASNGAPELHVTVAPAPALQPAQAAWFAWMDFFRTAAAVIVVVSHARDVVLADYNGNVLYAPFYAATGLGHSGVVIFFVLSGFWISRSVLGRIDAALFWQGYLIDRLSRLLIVLVPALALGGVLDWVGAVHLGLPLYSGTSGAHSITGPVTAQLTLPVLLGNLAFLQTIAVPTWGSNGPLWSLAYEFWFYIWFPALALLIVQRRFSLALLSLVIAWFNPAIAVGFASWLMGFALLKSDRIQLGGVISQWWVMLVTGLFVAILLASGVFNGASMDFVLALAFAGLLFILRAGEISFPRYFEPLARFGRDSSYSLYVVHFPVLALAGSLANRGVRMMPSPLGIALVVTLTVGCIAAGWAFSEVTERKTGKARAFLRARFG